MCRRLSEPAMSRARKGDIERGSSIDKAGNSQS
jgi:hypothetical protein